MFGCLGWTQTSDLKFRKLALYSAELRDKTEFLSGPADLNDEEIKAGRVFGGHGRVRTYDQSLKRRPLYLLSYVPEKVLGGPGRARTCKTSGFVDRRSIQLSYGSAKHFFCIPVWCGSRDSNPDAEALLPESSVSTSFHHLRSHKYFIWYEEGDSNSYARRQRYLKPWRLPIPPSSPNETRIQLLWCENRDLNPDDFRLRFLRP